MALKSFFPLKGNKLGFFPPLEMALKVEGPILNPPWPPIKAPLGPARPSPSIIPWWVHIENLWTLAKKY